MTPSVTPEMITRASGATYHRVAFRIVRWWIPFNKTFGGKPGLVRYISPELYELLVLTRGWPLDGYGRFIADAMIAALLEPGRPTFRGESPGLAY